MQGRSNRFHQIRESGSGIIVEIEGETYILTNGHVLADASLEGIKIVLEDGRELRPKRVRSNNDYDIAAIEIEENELVPARIGDSDRVQIGDFVVTIGSPFGLSRSVTSGIISAKGRNRIPLGEKAGSVQDFLQTDAAINPGNSGGPLIDSRGRVIGMVTAIATSSGGSEGVGFAIPINLVMRIARQLVGSGRVLRPYLGVELDPNYNMEKAQEAGLKTRKGTRISTVHSNSPAAKAGLARGDIILTVDQREITDDDHLVNVIGLKEVGETIHLVGVRGEIPFETDVELESQPSE
jgi:serine protease Do